MLRNLFQYYCNFSESHILAEYAQMAQKTAPIRHIPKKYHNSFLSISSDFNNLPQVRPKTYVNFFFLQDLGVDAVIFLTWRSMFLTLHYAPDRMYSGLGPH